MTCIGMPSRLGGWFRSGINTFGRALLKSVSDFVVPFPVNSTKAQKTEGAGAGDAGMK